MSRRALVLIGVCLSVAMGTLAFLYSIPLMAAITAAFKTLF